MTAYFASTCLGAAIFASPIAATWVLCRWADTSSTLRRAQDITKEKS